jgi:hypothetical protein
MKKFVLPDTLTDPYFTIDAGGAVIVKTASLESGRSHDQRLVNLWSPSLVKRSFDLLLLACLPVIALLFLCVLNHKCDRATGVALTTKHHRSLNCNARNWRDTYADAARKVPAIRSGEDAGSGGADDRGRDDAAQGRVSRSYGAPPGEVREEDAGGEGARPERELFGQLDLGEAPHGEKCARLNEPFADEVDGTGIKHTAAAARP